MQSSIHGIRVGVIHGPGNSIRPVWFDLNRRKHSIREVTNSWCEKRGGRMLHHFHVVDEGALYELVYDLESGCWELVQVDAL